MITDKIIKPILFILLILTSLILVILPLILAYDECKNEKIYNSEDIIDYMMKNKVNEMENCYSFCRNKKFCGGLNIGKSHVKPEFCMNLCND